MNGKVPPPSRDPDWARLLEAERKLEAQIAAAQADARTRVAQARAAAAAAAPDPGALAELAATQEQADIEQHRAELARIAGQADTTVRALTDAPASLIEALAQLALGALLTDGLAVERR